MAFVRILGKFSSTSVVRNNLANRNVHQIASSRLFSSSPMLSAVAQKPATTAEKAKTPPTIGKRDPLDTSFNDPVAAFKSKTTFELIRGYMVYLICSSETLVENNMKVRFSSVTLILANKIRLRFGCAYSESCLPNRDSVVNNVKTCHQLTMFAILFTCGFVGSSAWKIIDFSFVPLFHPHNTRKHFSRASLCPLAKLRLHDAPNYQVFFLALLLT